MYGCGWETQPFRKPRGYYMLDFKKEKDRLFLFSICFHQISITNTWRKTKKKRRTERCVCGSDSATQVWIQLLRSGLLPLATRVLGHPAPPSVLHRLKAHTWRVTFIQTKYPYTFLKNKKKVLFFENCDGFFLHPKVNLNGGSSVGYGWAVVHRDLCRRGAERGADNWGRVKETDTNCGAPFNGGVFCPWTGCCSLQCHESLAGHVQKHWTTQQAHTT